MTSKYLNRRVAVDGIQFASVKEGNRYRELRLLELAGEISALRMQYKFNIDVNGLLICSYVSDFIYFDKDKKLVVEDVKSAVTRKLPVYRIKKKLMKACLGINVVEV